MKIKQNKTKLILLIALFQIILLTNLSVSQSYGIHQTDFEIENAEIQLAQNDIINNLVGSGINLIIGFLSIKQIGTVSASSILDERYCCPVMANGATCQNLVSDNLEECAEETLPVACDQVTECQPGCCIDETEGICDSNAPKENCEQNQGLWKSDASCLVEECQKGCCTLGSKVEFTTKRRCTKLSLERGSNVSYGANMNELECIVLKGIIVFGACITSGNVCKFKTELECAEVGGEFNENILCSNPVLESECIKQQSVGCVEGKDEIYWFDSCGNRENIYSSNKDISWNGGRILLKGDSCNPLKDNIDSEICGNCNYFLGSQCKESKLGEINIENGDFVCGNKNCVEENENYGNGESWCVYDAAIGDGKDPVGSRHWIHSCVDGEIKSSGCADYRGGICVQSEDSGFSTAVCSVNGATECSKYNQEKDMGKREKLCEEDAYCSLKKIDIDEGFTFSLCTGAYPRGIDLTGKNYEKAQEICSVGSQKCTMIYVKKLNAKWKCEANCDCDTQKFTDQMNDLCISMGDCGSYINYVGDGADSAKTTRAPQPSWKDYIGYASRDKSKFADPKDPKEILASLGKDKIETGEILDAEYDEASAKKIKSINAIGAVSGAAGKIVSLAAVVVPSSMLLQPTAVVGAYTYSIAFEFIPKLVGTQTAPALAPTTVGVWLSGIGYAFSALGGAFMGAQLAVKIMGVEGDAAATSLIAGAVVGTVMGATFAFGGAGAAAVASFGVAGTGALGAAAATAAVEGVSVAATVGTTGAGGFGASLATFAVAMVWAIVVVVVVAAIMKIIGIGKMKKVVVEFDCMPWAPPVGGDNCKLCNEDPLKPCTEYRCTSLGAACQIGELSKNTENPICEKIENDFKAPIIFSGDISHGYIFENEKRNKMVEIRKENGECINEFQMVKFSLKTNENTQCRISTIGEINEFEEMTEYFAEDNLFGKTHSLEYTMPSIQSLTHYINLTRNDTNSSEIMEELEEAFENMNILVRCQDVYGNMNKENYKVNFCVNSGPDITPAYIVNSIPANNGFIKYEITETNALFYLNEPAECKYSLTPEEEYSNMSFPMICDTNLIEVGLVGGVCTTNLTNLNEDMNNIYIKCKDQPWLPAENDSLRNINTDDYKYTLYASESELMIDSISPSEEIDTTIEPISVDLEVKTSGGIEDGTSECSFSFLGYDNMIRFKDTNSNMHKQTFNTLMGGYRDVYISCKDKVGNNVNVKTNITVNIDTSTPSIIRVYRGSGSLILITNEIAECVYDLENCNYLFDLGTPMATVKGTQHLTAWNTENTLYIKCKDEFGNLPKPSNQCSIVVQPLQQ